MRIHILPELRQLFAVTDLSGKGVFIRYGDDQKKSVYFREGVCELTEHTLEQLLEESKDRKALYQGDSIHIQF